MKKNILIIILTYPLDELNVYGYCIPRWVNIIDKTYIDGPCELLITGLIDKFSADFFDAYLEKVSQVTMN